jgi:hypothetical protein
MKSGASYPPSTRLSYAGNSECCTVLTDGNVMLTKCLNIECRIEMKLVDWLILADGKEVEEYIPCPAKEITKEKISYYNEICSNEFCANAYRLYSKGREEGRTEGEMTSQYSEALRKCRICNSKDAPTQVPTNSPTVVASRSSGLLTPDPSHVFPIGTKLRWNADDTSEEIDSESSSDYQIAVITKNGTLVVKDSTRSVVTYTKRLFENPVAWYKSLPNNGCVEATVYKAVSEKNTRYIPGVTRDVDLVRELMNRYKVNQYYKKNFSASQNLANYEEQMKRVHTEVSKITLEQDIENPQFRMNYTKKLMMYVTRFKNFEFVVRRMTDEQKHWRPMGYIYCKGASKLWLSVDGQEKLITVFEDKIVVDGIDIVDSFREIPHADFVNGVPKLGALYRNKEINLY